MVGAGPGDVELITLKGYRLLGKAEVVVNDHLASKELLEFAPKTAEIVYVGKQDCKHTMKQEDINELLVQKAKEGKMVVRLKGGDPFVFGRGGEEALYLHKNNVPFEIVPGVTSAVAAPAYAGIPVTHRNYASSVNIITGHQKTGQTIVGIDWKSLATNKGTLIFLMGVHNLSYIVDSLLEEGKPKDTPVALIQWGTLKKQKTVVGVMSDIVEKVEAEKLTPPAVIVVGEVVSLRKELNWFQ